MTNQRETGDRGDAPLENLDHMAPEDLIPGQSGFASGAMPNPNSMVLPGPVADAFFHDDDKVAVIQGPVGSGKTTTLYYALLRRAVMMPISLIDGWRDYRVLITRQTYRQLWSTSIPSYLKVIPKSAGHWMGGRGGPAVHVCEFEDGHGPIRFTAEFMAFGDDIVSALRGYEVTDMVPNEIDTQPVDILANGITRIGRWPEAKHFKGYGPEHRSYGQIRADMNAPDQDNWTFRTLHDEGERIRVTDDLNASLPKGTKPVRINFYRQPGAFEPGAENMQNLSPDYYPAQVAALRLSGKGDLLERLVHNNVTYLKVGVPVFEREFSPAVHAPKEGVAVDRDRPLLIGLDQGLVGAAVITQFRPPFHWSAVGEMMFPDEKLLASTFGSRLAELLETDRFAGMRIEAAWGDMAGEHGSALSASENATWNAIVSKKCGFTVRPQRIASNRIQPRLEAVRAPLEYLGGGAPGLVIDRNHCPRLFAGFTARYVWTAEMTSTGDKRKVPDKSFAEANVMDALQYVLLSRVRADGTSDQPDLRQSRALRGRPSGPRGLQTGFDVANPYGARS